MTSEVIYDPSNNTYIVQQGGTKNVCDNFAKIIYLKSTQLDVATRMKQWVHFRALWLIRSTDEQVHNVLYR